MTQRTRAELKLFYETGDIPTQIQFGDFIDSAPNILDNSIMLGGAPAFTAFAGGGQGNATLLTTLFTTVTVCAAPGDSILLPVGGGGRWVGIVNATANSCNCFPQVGAQIDLLGVNVAFPIASGERWLFASTQTNYASFAGQ